MNKELTKDIIQWDVKSWSQDIHYWDNMIDWRKYHNCLELGAREGGLSLWLSLKNKSVICSDIKETKERAYKLHSKYNVLSLISYEDIDAINIPYENHFDVIAFKSIIGGIGYGNNIERQKKVFDEIFKSLKKGGILLFSENLKASRLHQILRKKNVRWSDNWRYISIDEIDFFLNKFASYNIHYTGFLGTMGRNEKQRNIFSLIDKYFLNKICPNTWKYITYGIAYK